MTLRARLALIVLMLMPAVTLAAVTKYTTVIDVCILTMCNTPDDQSNVGW